MKKIFFKLFKLIALLFLLRVTNIFLSSCFSQSEEIISKEKEIVNNNFNDTLQSKTIYVSSGSGNANYGDGSEKAPYENLQYAINQANDGDVIQLLADIVYTKDTGKPFVIDKAISIDGTKNTTEQFGLQFRGMDLELRNNVTFKNLNLKFLKESHFKAKIYISDYTVTFNNVNTKLSNVQRNKRPTLIAGTYGNKTGGNHAIINIINATGETRFDKILAGDEDETKSTPTTISIADRTEVSDGIDLAADGQRMNGMVSITSASSSVKKFLNGKNALNNQITITGQTSIFGATLDGIKDLTLGESTSLSTDSGFSELSGRLTLNNDSSFDTFSSSGIKINKIQGKGELVLPLMEDALVANHINNSIQINIRPDFNQDVDALDGKPLFKIKNNIDRPKVSIERNNHIKVNYTPVNQENIAHTGNLKTSMVRLKLNHNKSEIFSQFEVNYISNKPKDYFKFLKESLKQGHKVITNIGDENSTENPIIYKNGDKVTEIQWNVSDPGRLIINGVESFFDITNTEDSQIVSYTISQPSNGYYEFTDGKKFSEVNYNKAIVLTGESRFIDIPLRLVKKEISGDVSPPSNTVIISALNPYKINQYNNVYLALESKSRGLVITRVNNLSMIKFPEKGMIVYNQADDSFYYYSTKWTKINLQ